jgi:hypothetical protein
MPTSVICVDDHYNLFYHPSHNRYSNRLFPLWGNSSLFQIEWIHLQTSEHTVLPADWINSDGISRAPEDLDVSAFNSNLNYNYDVLIDLAVTNIYNLQFIPDVLYSNLNFKGPRLSYKWLSCTHINQPNVTAMSLVPDRSGSSPLINILWKSAQRWPFSLLS